METNKRFCSIKRIIRTFDFFGESFTFRYKDEDKLSTVLGGVIVIIFLIVSLAYAIYNFIPFINKDNFSLQYYTMNLDNTEEIKLSESPTAFGVGFTDNNKNQTLYNISDLLEIKFKFKNINKNNQNNKGTYINETRDSHPCNNDDFHNLYNKSLEDLDISNFKCLSRKDLISPSGIYTDEVFSYFVISVESKDKDNETHNQLINDYLIANDCKLQFYYTDITIDINNVTHPFSSILNSMFLQLNPTLIQKKNIFYMNYHLLNDKQIIHIKKNDGNETTKTGLSRVEDYALYKGLDRVNNKVEDYEVYAKMYIRADNKKIEIKRRYQDLMEFYADTSSLLLSLFWILGIIFAYYDKIKANHSISKQLFYFQGIKYNNNFQNFKNLKNSLNEKLTRVKLPNQDNNVFQQSTRIPPNSNERIINNNNQNANSFVGINNEPKNKEDKNIDFSGYNIFEMLASFKICFCKKKKLELKINLIKQARKMIDDKLEVVFYIRNMFSFETIKKIYLKNNEIIEFLSRPIIYLKNDNIDEEKITNLNGSYPKPPNKISREFTGDMKINTIEEKENRNYERNEEKSNQAYKYAYNYNHKLLSKEIDNLKDIDFKSEPQKNLFNLLKNRLDGV